MGCGVCCGVDEAGAEFVRCTVKRVRGSMGMLAGVAAGLLALGGCQSAAVPRGMPDDAVFQDSYFYGHWHGDDDRQLNISEGSGKSFNLKITDKLGTRTYQGHLVRVDEFPFAELCLYTPGKDEAKKVPVFLYAAVRLDQTSFTFRPLRPEWMREHVKQIEGAAFIQTPDRPRTEGGVVVRDVDSMKKLLRAALASTDAFEKGETYTRQQ